MRNKTKRLGVGALCLLVLFVGKGCDSPTMSGAEEVEQPSIAELHSKAKALGIRPEHVNFDRMYELGDFDTFTDLGAPVSRRQLQLMKERWPNQVNSDFRIALKTAGLSKVEYDEGIPDQEDSCFYFGPDYDSEFCQCVRDPVTCEADLSDPQDDYPPGGGNGGDNDDGEDGDDGGDSGGDACAGIDTSDEASIEYGSNLMAMERSSGYLAYNGHSWTRGILSGWPRYCFTIDAQVQARLKKYLRSGGSQVVATKSSNSNFSYDYVDALFNGVIGVYNLEYLELSADHSVEFQFLTIAGPTISRNSEAQYVLSQ